MKYYYNNINITKMYAMHGNVWIKKGNNKRRIAII